MGAPTEVLARLAAEQFPEVDLSRVCLKHSRTGYVPMSTPLSLGSVEPNSLLEVVPIPLESSGASPSNKKSGVTVAFDTQLPSSIGLTGRQTVSCPTAAVNLWDLIGKLEEATGCSSLRFHTETHTVDGTSSTVYWAPVIQVMRRDFTSFRTLRTMSLKKLGLERGNVLVRLTLKPSDLSVDEVRRDMEAFEEECRSKAREQTEAKESAAAVDGDVVEKKVKLSAKAASSVSEPVKPKAVDHFCGQEQLSETSIRLRKSLELLRAEILALSLPSSSDSGDATSAAPLEARLAPYEGALTIMTKILRNLLKVPKEAKFRNLTLHGKLEGKLGRFKHACTFLHIVGFIPNTAEDPLGENGTVHIVPETESEERVNKALEKLQVALDIMHRDVKVANEERARAKENEGHMFTFAQEEEKRRLEQEEASKPAPPPTSVFDLPPSDDEEDDDEQRGVDIDASSVLDLTFIKERCKRESFGESVSDADYQTCLSTIITVCKNLQKVPAKPTYRCLNLLNEKFREKAGKYAQALDVLEWMGFQIEASADGQTRQMLLHPDKEDHKRVERVKAVANRYLSESQVAVVDTSPIPRVMKVFDDAPTVVVENPNLLSKEDEVELEPDASLILKAWAQNERSMKEKQYFVSKRRLEEEKAKSRRKYEKTVVRFAFRSLQITIQGEFNPNEPASALLSFIKPLLRDENTAFHLRIPPVSIIREGEEASLAQLGLVPAASLNFMLDDSEVGPDVPPVLSDAIIAQKQVMGFEAVPTAICEEEKKEAPKKKEEQDNSPAMPT